MGHPVGDQRVRFLVQRAKHRAITKGFPSALPGRQSKFDISRSRPRLSIDETLGCESPKHAYEECRFAGDRLHRERQCHASGTDERVASAKFRWSELYLAREQSSPPAWIGRRHPERPTHWQRTQRCGTGTSLSDAASLTGRRSRRCFPARAHRPGAGNNRKYDEAGNEGEPGSDRRKRSGAGPADRRQRLGKGGDAR